MVKPICLIIVSILFMNNVYCQKIDNKILESEILKADSLIENNPKIFFKNVESLIVYSQGRLVFEKYYNGFSKDSLHQIQSQTKSIVALLMGIAIDKGFVKSENELVSKYFPNEFNGTDKLKSTVTIRDLLTMSAGLSWEEMVSIDDPANDNMNMFRSDSWLNYALNKPMITKPYTEFKYNSGLPMIVAGIIEKSTKMRLDKFADKYLFEPLYINHYRWLKDKTGFCHAGGGLWLKPMDMVKIGVMIMNHGKWKNQQIISSKWIEKSTTPYLQTSFDIAKYGYFWWVRDINLSNGKSVKQLTAEGAGGQKLYIFPDYNLIISFTERNYSTPQVSPMFIQESIIPLFK